MIAASPLPPAPAPAGPGPLGASDGADPAASAFAVLLAGLLPLPAPVVAEAGPPSVQAGLASGPDLPAPPATPAPALPAAAGSAGPPLAAGLSNASGGEATPAGVLPPSGDASAPPPSAAPQAPDSSPSQASSPPLASPQAIEVGAAPPSEPQVGTSAPAPLERPQLAPNLVAAPVPAQGNRASAPLPGAPPAPPATLQAQTIEGAAAPRPSVTAERLPSVNDDARPPPAKATDAPSGARAPAAAPEVPLAGAERVESAPTGDAATEPSIDIAEIAPGHTERSASEPPATSQRAAPPPPLVQVGVQIATAASRRVERMVVQLEPAALGRVEVRLDFSHDNRVSALIAADRPETLDVLQRDSRALERSLQDAGLRLADNALSFSLRQDHRQQQGAGAGPSGLQLKPPVGPAAQEDARSAQWFRAERVLDIRI